MQHITQTSDKTATNSPGERKRNLKQLPPVLILVYYPHCISTICLFQNALNSTHNAVQRPGRTPFTILFAQLVRQICLAFLEFRKALEQDAMSSSVSRRKVQNTCEI